MDKRHMLWREVERDDSSTQGESQVACLGWSSYQVNGIIIVLLLGGPWVAVMGQCRHLLKEAMDQSS